MEYWKEAQLRETIAELEFNNRTQREYLEQSRNTAKVLGNTDWVDRIIANHKKRETELEGEINDWKCSYNALLVQAKEYSNRLNVSHVEFLQSLNKRIFELEGKNINISNPMALRKYIKQLISDEVIYKIDFDDFIEWKDVRLHWTDLAEQGRSDAQYNLGWYYHDISEEKSLEWFTKAADSGDQRALKEIEKVCNRRLMNESRDLALEVIKVTKEGSIQQALELIKLGESKSFDWAISLAPYLSLTYENKNYKSIFYKGKDIKGIKIKNFIKYCELDLKNNSDRELIVKQPGSLKSGFLREKKLSEFIKIPPQKSVRVEIWPEEPAEVSSKSIFIDPQWFYPQFATKELPFQIPSNLKVGDIYHRIDNSSCFVVSTCFSDHSHPTVLTFRRFRDEVLVRNRVGRAFIKHYYRFGPYAADWISDKPFFMSVCRKLLLGLERLLFINRIL